MRRVIWVIWLMSDMSWAMDEWYELSDGWVIWVEQGMKEEEVVKSFDNDNTVGEQPSGG